MDGARALAQKMRPGFYVRKVDEGYKTMWVMRDWAPGGEKGCVNGFVKKLHPDLYSAVVWLIQRGCRLREGLGFPPEVYEECEQMRAEWEKIRESERAAAAAAQHTATPLAAGEPGALPSESDKDKPVPFALLEEELAEEPLEAYERVADEPPHAEAPEDSSAPSAAPEDSCPTPGTAQPELSEPALELGK